MKPARLPIRPAHPERTCWGCDTYCPADDLACGNGTIRTLHPCELFGDDWVGWFARDGKPPYDGGHIRIKKGVRPVGEQEAVPPSGRQRRRF